MTNALAVVAGKVLRMAGGACVTRPVAAAGATELTTNLAVPEYYDTTPVYTDLMYQGFGYMVFNTSTPVAVKPADGAPNVADVECVTQFIQPPTVDSDVVFEVAGNFTGAALRLPATGDSITSTGSFSGGVRQVTVHITAGRAADVIRLQLSGCTRASDGTAGFDSIIASRPGYTIAQVKTQRFTDEFQAFVAPFKTIRFMDWLFINGAQNFGQGADFTKRPTRTQRRTGICYSEDPTGATGKRIGTCYEDMIDLCNLKNKDIWLNIPFYATDAYVTSLVTMLQSTLTSNQKVYLEWVNELWNTSAGFEQFSALMQAVAAEVNGYAGADSRGGFVARYGVSATRTSNVVTLKLSQAHSYVEGQNVVIANVDGVSANTTYAITMVGAAADEIKFTKAGADGAVSIGGGGFSLVDSNTTSNLVAFTYNIYSAMAPYAIRRMKQISDLCRAVVGDAAMMTRYRPVFAWQSASGNFFSYLSWLNAVFGGTHPPSYYLYAFAHAPYYFVDGSPLGLANLMFDSSASITVADYVTMLQATAKYAKVFYGFEEKAVTAIHHGMEVICYEGGPDTGQDSGSVNNIKKSQAQIDPGMKQAYVDFVNDNMLYGSNATAYSMFYHGVGSANDSGGDGRRFWSTDSCDAAGLLRPKAAAMVQVAAAARPVPTRNNGLGTFDGRLYAGHYEDVTPTLLSSGTYPWWTGGDASLEGSISRLWYEPASTPQTRSISFVYTCNFASWQCHIDINGVRIAASQVISASPADLTTEKTLGPFSFTSRPGFNAVRLVKAAGGAGRDGQIRRLTFA